MSAAVRRDDSKIARLVKLEADARIKVRSHLRRDWLAHICAGAAWGHIFASTTNDACTSSDCRARLRAGGRCREAVAAHVCSGRAVRAIDTGSEACSVQGPIRVAQRN
jgi:hypothetical protein